MTCQNLYQPLWIRVTASMGPDDTFESTRLINLNLVTDLVPRIKGGTTINFSDGHINVIEEWEEILSRMQESLI